MEEEENIQCVYTKHGTFRMDINQLKYVECEPGWYCTAFFKDHELDCPKHPTFWERYPVVKK